MPLLVHVVNVGDGACTVLRAPFETMLIDCGAHDDPKGARSADRLAAVLGSEPQGLDAIVVSHFDADHWRGLAELPSRIGTFVGPIRLIYPRLPDSVRDVRTFMAALLTVMDGAAPHVNALKLQDAWKPVATDVHAYAYRRGDRFRAVGRNWTVHWPPAEVSTTWSSQFARVRQELEGFAERWPDLRKALADAYAVEERVRLEETSAIEEQYAPHLEGLEPVGVEWSEEPADAEWPEESVDAPMMSERGEEGTTFVMAPTPDMRTRLPKLYGELQSLNNALSLVISDDRGELLAMGDIEGWGLRRLLMTDDFTNSWRRTVLAPHHGTAAPKPAQAPQFPRASVVVAQTGAQREADRSSWYHRVSKMVHSTHLDGDFVTGRGHRYWAPWA